MSKEAQAEATIETRDLGSVVRVPHAGGPFSVKEWLKGLGLLETDAKALEARLDGIRTEITTMQGRVDGLSIELKGKNEQIKSQTAQILDYRARAQRAQERFEVEKGLVERLLQYIHSDGY